MSAYKLQRSQFERVRRQYIAYLQLYRFFNAGSLSGAALLSEFYMLHTYYVRYGVHASISSRFG